jgi:alpha 1,3-glucosidase
MDNIDFQPLTDPYRLYNLDVFEYEMESTAALYGSIPFMAAMDNAGEGVGVYWDSHSEMWIDVERKVIEC